MSVANHAIPIESHETFPPTFMAVVLHIYGGKGHVLSYHNAVWEAVRLNGWNHLAVVSPDPVLKELPREWNVEYVDSGVLDHEGTEIIRLLKRLHFWAFFKSTYILALDFTRVLRKELESRGNRKILFLESFNPLQLLSFVISLLFVKRDRLSVWLMYRGGPDWGGRKHRLMAKSFAFLFRATNPIIRLLVGRDNLVLLTDSEILSTSLPNYYKSPVHLVPIPHTPAHRRDILENQKSRDDVVCWWPGAPRAEKGADAIRRLVTVKDRNADKVTLVAAKSAGMTGVAGGIRVEMVDDKLDRDEYERRFFTSDLILLPYDRDIYGESTSGIFVESMVAGATPLVTKGTWMAYELEKRNLGELAIDWESDSIVQQIISIATSQSIKQKTEMMGLEYRSFHNIPFFAQVLNSLYRMMSSP